MQPGSPTSEELIAHAEALRRLARSLVRDEASAEDLVQDTLVAAWQSPVGPRHALGAWLKGITRNLARKRYREADRRQRRERRAARAEALPATAEAAAGIEMRRRVLALLELLPVTQRTALYLRYFEDLPPRRIAQRMACPVATVHTNLRRGRERLRSSLDESEGGERSRWVLALLPASASGGGRLAPALMGGLAMKKILTVTLGVALLMLGLWHFWGSSTNVDPPPSRSEALLSAKAPEGPALKLQEQSPAPDPGTGPLPESPPQGPRHLLSIQLEAKGPLLPGVVQVVVKPIRGMQPGERWDRKDVEVAAESESSPRDVDITALFAEHQQPLIELAVEINHPAYMAANQRVKPAMAEHDAKANVYHHRAAVRLRRASVIHGRVVDAAGAPLRRAVVGAWQPAGQRGFRKIAQVQTASDGTYRLRVSHGGVYTIVAMKNGFRPMRTQATVDQAGESMCGDLVLEVGSSVKGVVLLNDRPLPGAGVFLQPMQTDSSGYGSYKVWQPKAGLQVESWKGTNEDTFLRDLIALDSPDGLSLSRAGAVTDAEGRFVLRGLSPGRHHVRISHWCRAGLLHPALTGLIKERPIQLPQRELDLHIKASIVRFQISAGGQPLPDARVYVGLYHKSVKFSDEELAALAEDIAEDELVLLNRLSSELATLEPEGTTPPLLVPPGLELRVRVTCDGYREERRAITAKLAGEAWQEVFVMRRDQGAADDSAASPAEAQPERTQGTLILHLKTPAGVVIPRCAIGLYEPGEATPSRRRAQSDDNTFVVANIRPGTYRVVARPGGSWGGAEAFWQDAEANAEVRAGEETHLKLSTKRGGRIRMWVRDAQGRPSTSRCRVRNAKGEKLAVTFVSRVTAGEGFSFAGLSSGFPERPSEVLQALPPGRYMIEFCSYRIRDRNATQVRKEFELVAGQLLDLEIELPDP